MKTLTELLSVGEIDLATYTHVRDRVITVEALPIAVEGRQSGGAAHFMGRR